MTIQEPRFSALYTFAAMSIAVLAGLLVLVARS